MKGILAVVGLTGAVFVSGFAYSPGTDKAANESLYGDVMMPGERTPPWVSPFPSAGAA
jgi:hypothetical protein